MGWTTVGGKRKWTKDAPVSSGMSKAKTIAPGTRFYGDPKLQPTTPYVRGGKLGGKYDPKKKWGGYRTQKQMAQEIKAQPQQPQLQREMGVSTAQQFDAGGQPISVDTSIQQPPTAGGVPTPIPTTEAKGFFQRIADKLWGGNVNYEEAMQTQEGSQAIYEAMTPAEKVKYQAESVLGASVVGGQLQYAVSYMSNTIANYFLSKSAGKGLFKVTSKVPDIYKTHGADELRLPGGIPPKDYLYQQIYKTNTKTVSLAKNLVSKILDEFKKPATVKSVILSAIGLTSLGEWGRGDALEGIDYTMTQAINTGDRQLILDTRNIVNEIDDPALWEQMLRVVPGAGVIPGLYQRWKSHVAKMKVNDFLADRLLNTPAGEEEKLSDFNQERLDVEAEVLRMKEESQTRIQAEKVMIAEALAKARKEADEESRVAWYEYRKSILALEKAQSEAIAQFWLEYLKMKQELVEENTKSHLGFGLL